MNKARQVASEELDLDFQDFLNEQPQSATVSKTMDDQGRRITKRADGSTTTSGAMGSVTRAKTGFKTQEKTPRLGGVSVTRKFDPNEKIIEYKIKNEEKKLCNLSLTDFLQETASESPAPGGGSISAYIGS